MSEYPSGCVLAYNLGLGEQNQEANVPFPPVMNKPSAEEIGLLPDDEAGLRQAMAMGACGARGCGLTVRNQLAILTGNVTPSIGAEIDARVPEACVWHEVPELRGPGQE